MIRLQKYLAECGVASRRASEQLIGAGRVTVNGKTAGIGDVVDPAADEVAVDGRSLDRDGKVYIILNKPCGVITSVKDTHDRKTVIDCVMGVRARVFPVGRLDKDVEGALLLTNDGDLAFRLTHPSYQVAKIYLAWVNGVMTPETAVRIEKGVKLEDGKTGPAEVIILNTGAQTTLVRLVLREGRKREIKRMCEAVGHPVRELRRIAVGGIRVKGLRPGEWRYLNDSEINRLHRLTGLKSS